MIFILRCCKFSRESDRFRKKIPRKQTENWLNISETIWNGKEEGFFLFRAEVQTMRGGEGERERERERAGRGMGFALQFGVSLSYSLTA
jgi:hypothetical protein